MGRNTSPNDAATSGNSSLHSRYLKIYLAIIVGNAVLWSLVFSFIY